MHHTIFNTHSHLALLATAVITALSTAMHPLWADAIPKRSLRNGKKIIQFGWNTPSRLAQYQRPLEELEENAPFDGIGIWLNLDLNRGGKTVRYDVGSAKGAPQLLREEDFKEWIPALKRLNQTRLKNNFIRSSSVLFQADWFNDEAWKRTLNNFSMLAWLAKQAEFKGISLDIEAYSFTDKPFMYRPDSGHTFQETEAQIRKRAAEWTRELNRQFPGLTLFTFFWTSQCNSAFKAQYPSVQNSSTTGLQIAFFNGVYDAAPDNMTIVDGNEAPGYKAATAADYDKIVSNYYLYGNGWLDPSLHAKHNAITQLGFSLYLDSYIPRENPGPYTLFARSPNPAQLLFENVRNALEHSDEYVWVWTERGTFWPKITGSPKAQFWNDRLPFVVEAIDLAAHTNSLIGDLLGENLMVNGEMSASDTQGTHPIDPGHRLMGVPGWSSWQAAAAKKGSISAENDTIVFRKVERAAVTQVYRNFKPGELYRYSVLCKPGNSCLVPYINTFFRNKQGVGRFDIDETAYFTHDEGNGWKRAVILLKVPDIPDIVSLSLCCNVTGPGPATPDSDPGVIFDKAEFRRINIPWNNPEKASVQPVTNK